MKKNGARYIERSTTVFPHNKSFCGCFTDRGGFFKKSPWPPEAKKRIRGRGSGTGKTGKTGSKK